MIPLFLGLTLANLAGLATAAVLGYLAVSGSAAMGRHTLIATLATFLCCAVHCVVFTYFIATAKWIQFAVTTRRLDPALVAPTRSFKALAFPASIGAIAATFLAAIAGTAVQTGQLSLAVHHGVAIAALVANLAAAALEFSAIRRNGLLIDRILELAQRRSNAEAELLNPEP